MLATPLETEFVRRAQLLGWDVLRTSNPGSGAPSHMLLLPDGVVRLVELRNCTNLTACQKAWHERSRDLGTTVVIVRSSDHLKRWFARLAENMAPQPGRPGRPSKEMALAKTVANRCIELDHECCTCFEIIETILLPWKTYPPKDEASQPLRRAVG